MNPKLAVGAALAGAFALGAMLVAYSSGEETGPQEKARTETISSSFSLLQENEIRKIIRDYLLTNPEVIYEAAQAFEDRERERIEAQIKEVAREHLSSLLDPKHGFVAGKNPDRAKVALIEFYDYHCGYCKTAAPVIQEIIENDPDVMVVFRELPVLRPESQYAAEMSLAAREQNKFIELHLALMGAAGVLNKERMQSFAEAAGLDFDLLEKSRTNNDIAAAIMENHDIAEQMGINGTPTFIVAAIDGSYIDIVSGLPPGGTLEFLNGKFAEAVQAQ